MARSTEKPKKTRSRKSSKSATAPPADPPPPALAAPDTTPIVISEDPVPPHIPPVPATGIPSLMTRPEVFDMFRFGHNARMAMECSPIEADGSDIEVSEPTINLLADRGITKVLLCSLLSIEKSCVHRQRRFMYGNDRNALVRTEVTGAARNATRR